MKFILCFIWKSVLPMRNLIIFFLLVVSAFAYSTDVPTKTITSTGAQADMNAAIADIQGRAEDGWTLVVGVAGGSYTWDKTVLDYMDFTSSYNFTVRGASPSNRPTITHDLNVSVSYAPGKLVTVKDMIFILTGTRGNGSYNSVLGSGPTPGFRFSNIRWEKDGIGQLAAIGTRGGNPGTSEEGPFGLFDNCTAETTAVDGMSIFIYCNNGSADELAASPSWRRPMEWGSTKAVYFEDCDFRNTAGVIAGWTITDSFNGGSFVFRKNRVENIMIADHGADHYANAVKSTLKQEIYDNDLYVTNGSNPWMIFLRGGTAVINDNRFHATGSATANHRIYWDYYRANSGAGPANSIYDRFYNPLNTTIAAGSNGQSLGTAPRTVNVADTTAFLDNPTNLVGPVYTSIAAGSNGLNLPQGTIHVADTTAFPSAGVLQIGVPNQVGIYGDFATVDYTGKTGTTFTGCTTRHGSTRLLSTNDIVAGVGVGEESKFSIYIEFINITTSAGVQTVTATGKTATTLTGVRGGTGTMSTGAAVTRGSDYLGTQQPGSGTITALIAAGSNGVTLPQGTIHVDSTLGFPTSGTLVVNYDWTAGTSQTAGKTVTYTGKTSTTFTGCTGGTVTMATGQVVGGIGQDPRHPLEIWGRMPIWQWNNTVVEGSVGATGKSVHDFIETDRDIFIKDDQPTKPTETGTWLDNYAPLAYPHPLRNVNQVSAPTFSPVAGVFTTPQSVTITSATGGATIRYTTNGVDPTSASGTVYSTPVAISVNTTLKAIAYDGVQLDSNVTTGSYLFIGAGDGNVIGTTTVTTQLTLP